MFLFENVIHITINYFLYNACPAADLPHQDPHIGSDAIQMLIKDLEQKRDNFRVVNANEMTCREFISTFMNSAVTHVRSNESELQLKAEEWINGSRGYGPVDYSVNLSEVVILVEEAKKEDFEKRAAQNIVQMHSAIEVRKLLHLKFFAFAISTCFSV
jgi:hypothetical protein